MGATNAREPEDGPTRARPRRGRRQWGADRRAIPPSPVAHPVGKRAVSAARFAVFFTVGAWLALVVDQADRLLRSPFSARHLFDTALFVSIVTLLSLSATAYLVARLGALDRLRRHHRVPRALIDEFVADSMASLTVLVPSYKEQERVIRQTLLSAALQEYPDIRVVLLVDDPPDPSDPADIALLDAARALPGRVTELLSVPRGRFERALSAFEHDRSRGHDVGGEDLLPLAALYEEAATWLRVTAGDLEAVDHSDDFLRDAVLGRLASDFDLVANALRQAVADGARLSRNRARQLYRRLAWTFRAELTSFERKRYASLSHEPNKAMNLNSYLALMGGRYREQHTPRGPVLLPVRSDAYDLEVPDPDYVLTLDADSILLPEYCLRLVYLLEQPEHADVAVMQTPYASYPGAATRIERIAGATTDLQYLVHQGLTRHDATFWVGANAVLRKRALDDIVEEEERAGFRIKRYIADRTVIEDTESSIDITAKGWRLHNYPERLSYSATPPDFGSLCVQRRRWANGGLVILPKMLRLRRERRAGGARASVAELFLRSNYLASISWASLGLLVLLAYPFDPRLLSPFAVLTAAPYLAAMSTDLRRSGYRRSDVARIYGFNLLLLPVNVAGVVSSLGQAIGGQKIAFARTPKVRNRTVAPLAFVVVPFVIVGFSLVSLVRDLSHGNEAHAAFAGVNAALTAYALVAFVGLRHAVVDIWRNVVERLYRPGHPATADADWAPDWVTVLYHGGVDTHDTSENAPRAAALALVDRNPTDDVELDWRERPGAERSVPARASVGAGAGRDRPRPGTARQAAAGADAPVGDLGALARSLVESVRDAGTGGRVVMRLDGSTVEVTLELDAAPGARSDLSRPGPAPAALADTIDLR